MSGPRGRLEVIATPIGNIGDWSPRARETLAAADLVLAEDTRRTAALLASCGISRPLLSLHDHNETARCQSLVERLSAGAVLALVSDAGTPLLSDPGFVLVRSALAAGIEVRSIAGPSAITAALAVAGLPTERFVFEGFLATAAGARRTQLARLAQETRTVVLFEAPHRIARLLAELTDSFGAQRPAALARELSKLHETVYRGSLSELAQRAAIDPDMVRGEMTLVIGGAGAAVQGDAGLLARALPLLLKDLPPARAAAIAAQLSGTPRRVAYEQAVRLATPGSRKPAAPPAIEND